MRELGYQDPDVSVYSGLFETRPLFNDQHHVTAYLQLVIITKALNEGWEASEEQSMYLPSFHLPDFACGGSERWDEYSHISLRLAFRTAELADHAGRIFVNIYKQWML